MITKPMRWTRSVILIAAITAVASCALIPNAAPNKRQIYAGSVQRQGDAFRHRVHGDGRASRPVREQVTEGPVGRIVELPEDRHEPALPWSADPPRTRVSGRAVARCSPPRFCQRLPMPEPLHVPCQRAVALRMAW